MKNRKVLKITIVTPVYNEEKAIAHFHSKTKAVLSSLKDVRSNIIFVVDRCTDNTVAVLRTIVANDADSKVLLMSSRFGQQMSLLAGIEQSLDADAIIMMDSDLQHPPELIPKLISHFRNDGCDVVFTLRQDTEGIGKIRKMAGNLFYWLLGKLSDIEINANAADFRLISKRVAKILATRFPEKNMFLRGLFTWIGFKQIGVEYPAERRVAGSTKYSFGRLWEFAMSGILSFSTKPLQMGIFLGVSFSAISFIYLIVAVTNYFVDRTIPTGYTTIVTLLLLFSGVQLIVLGILGAYIGAMYKEIKGRPRYIIDEEISAAPRRTRQS